MLRIEIVHDGENEVVVNQQEIGADAEQLVRLVERWQTVVDEPCQYGHECVAIKKLLRELMEIIGG